MARSGSADADRTPRRQDHQRPDDIAARRANRPADRARTEPRPKEADTDLPAAGPSLTVAAVARRLGVAPATLRTWDRRYGLGPSEHSAGSHRRYSGEDVARLLVMRRLTLEGVAPSEAARTALQSQEPAGDAPSATAPSLSEVVDAYSDAVPMAPDPPALVAAAGHFDNAAVRWMLARVHPRDPLAWWSELVGPALQTLTGKVALQAPGEHAAPALTAAAFAELRSRAAVSLARRPERDDEQVPVVLALCSGGGTDLLIHVVATALQEKGVRVRVLSAATARSAAEVVSRLRPSAVIVEIGSDGQDLAGEVARTVEAVVGADDQVPVFVHRDGAAAPDLPVAATVHRVRTLTGALHEVLAAVG